MEDIKSITKKIAETYEKMGPKEIRQKVKKREEEKYTEHNKVFGESIKESITINTRSYETVHGGKPGSKKAEKALGPAGPHTQWTFKIDNKEVNFRGTWASASKDAKSHAKKAGVTEIEVLT